MSGLTWSRPDLDDRTVKPDRRRALAQPTLFLELVDLRVALDQDRLRTRLPGQDRLFPDGGVVLLAGLRAKDGKLSGRRLALDEVDLGRRAQRHGLEPGRVVDVHHRRVPLDRNVRVQVRDFVAVVVAVEGRPRDPDLWAHPRAAARQRGVGASS